MKYAIAGTVVYLILVTCAALMMGEPPTKANEWGDYAAGFVAPVALAWFIGTLVLQRNELAMQRQELELQREEMKLTRGVLEEQTKMQLKSAEAMLEANKIAASTLFAEGVERRKQTFDQMIQDIGNVMPNLKFGTNDPTMDLALGLLRPDTVSSAIDYFDHLLSGMKDPGSYDLSDKQLGTLLAYVVKFEEFGTEAAHHDRLSEALGPHNVLCGRIQEFLKQRRRN